MLRDAGVEVVNLELVGTEVLDDLSEFGSLVSQLDSYDGVFFTSPVAAQVFVDRTKSPVGPTLYALGRRAATVLENGGFSVVKVPHANTVEEMLAGSDDAEFAAKKLLFVRGERSMRTIPDAFGGIADVDEVAVYRTVEIEPAKRLAADIRNRLESGDIESVCFFSPSAVEAFEKRFGLAAVSVATIGETTAARARALGFNIELVASRATNEVFAAELLVRIKEQQIV
jgi:uroporphyrinogen-III synthase